LADYFAPPEWRNRPFTKEEIKRAVDIFESRIYNPYYYPKNKEFLKKMHIAFFFKSKQANSDKGKSWFLLSFTEPPETAGNTNKTLEDRHPAVTSRLIERYKQEILGTNGYKLPEKDQQAFIRASIRLKEYMKENKVSERTHFNCNDRNIADWLFGAVFYASGRTEYTVTPGWFCSDLTFERRLPAYLQKQAIVGERMFRGRQ
jgi:hypothetical protein